MRFKIISVMGFFSRFRDLYDRVWYYSLLCPSRSWFHSVDSLLWTVVSEGVLENMAQLEIGGSWGIS